MSVRGRARGPRRGSPLKVMMNMQAATGYSYSGIMGPPMIIRRARGRARGARGRRDLLLLGADYTPPARGRKKELLLLDTDSAGPVIGPASPPAAVVNRKRKELMPLDSDNVASAAPVDKRRRKVLRLESDDEFSDMDLGSLVPHSYNKGNVEDQLPRVERCRLCDKPAVDSTSLSTCTSTTKIQMYQKLNKIVSVDNLTLQEKQGILCSRCSRLLNYVDRIEVELSMLKKTIVECIHKKHNLYVPDESLSYDAVSGDEAGVEEESVTMHENHIVKEKRTALHTTRSTDSQMRNHDDFWDACHNSQMEDLVDSQVEDLVDSQVEDLVDSQVEDLVDSQVEDLVEPQVEDLVDSQVEDLVESQVEDLVESQVEDLVESQVEDLVESQVEDLVESHVEDLVDSQVEDVYGLAEDDDDTEISHETATEEDSDGEIPAEYLEPMFEETVISHEVDTWQKQGQNASNAQKQSSVRLEMEKSVSSSQGETDDVNRNTKHSVDDLDVRNLIEELTAEPQDEEDKPEAQSAETQDDESSEMIDVKDVDAKEYWRDIDSQQLEEEPELSQSREVTDSKGHIWKMSEESERHESEVDQDQQSNGSVQGSLNSSDTKKWEINDVDVINEEVTKQSKVICYDAGEWEDGDTQLPDKDDSNQPKKHIINITEQNNETDDEVMEKCHREDAITKSKVDGPEGILIETKETKPLIQAEEVPASVIEESQVEMHTGHELEETELEEDKMEEFKTIKTEITGIENSGNIEIETAMILVDVQDEQKPILVESTKQEENDVEAEGIKIMHVVEKSDVEGERTDTCDEDEKLSDDEKMSVEIKWTTDSETEGTESNDEDVLKSQGKLTDDHTVTDVSNAETLESYQLEKTGVYNENEAIVKSPQEAISEMQVDEGSTTSLNVDSNVQNDDVQQRIEKTFLECNTGLGEEESDHNIHKEDSTDAVEGHIQEEQKIETSVSNSMTETKFSSNEQEEVNSDRKQEEKLLNEGIEEEIKREDMVNSIRDNQQDTQMPTEEVEPEIEVLEFNKTEDSGSVQCIDKNSCADVNQSAESSKIIPREKPIADMLEEHLASILSEEPLSGEQGELFGMDVDSITNITGKSSIDVQGSNSIVTLQTEESVISMLEEPVTSTQGSEIFADVSDEKSVIIIDEDEETDHSQSAMLAGMGLIGQSTHALSDLCGTASDVECVDISSD